MIIYDLLAPKWDHRTVDASRLQAEFPGLNVAGLTGGMLYYDAGMDDSRVLIRVLREACREGEQRSITPAQNRSCAVWMAPFAGQS